MKTRNYYSALAQEKTGGFWVDGRLYGKQNCHPTEDVENAEVVLFIGTNPWQSHGIRNARVVLREIQKDPKRKMIVIDPRKTETAAMADLHLQLRPGTDAFLMSAILSVIVREELEAREFISAHTTGFSTVREALLDIPIDQYAEKAGIPSQDVYTAGRMIARAASCAVRSDLGIEQTLNSTLNAYLRSLISLITGNFARPGGNNLHSSLVPLIGHSPEGARQQRSAVTGFPFIGNLLPPNILPAEINNNHPDRTRGLIVDSANPMVTMADTKAYREAFAALDLLVVEIGQRVAVLDAVQPVGDAAGVEESGDQGRLASVVVTGDRDVAELARAVHLHRSDPPSGPKIRGANIPHRPPWSRSPKR